MLDTLQPRHPQIFLIHPTRTKEGEDVFYVLLLPTVQRNIGYKDRPVSLLQESTPQGMVQAKSYSIPKLHRLRSD